ncbi:MAG TPA: TraR/DksA C4-type zinc finger protein [Patescibacteria group bacterium]|nr:TraR/DksA C4-type zinc finger protein [Patescibacteria group bacterium]
MSNVTKFPSNLLKPVGDFLTASLATLKVNKKKISSEDPFNDKQRTLDNASPDTEAEEQFGHARVSAIKEELNRKSNQIKKALNRVKLGKYGICEDCGKMIDTDRLAIFPEATMCIKCEKKREK